MKFISEEKTKEILSKNYDDVDKLLSAFSNKKRLLIINLLLEESGEFSELIEVTQLSKTALAYHLEVLIDNGIVKHLNRGSYELSADGLILIQAIISGYDYSERKCRTDAAKNAEYLSKLYSKDKREEKLKVKLERLLPMRVACFNSGICKSPEDKAMEKLRSWAEPKGLFADLKENPIFGFNNRCPDNLAEKYGYEFWIRVNSDFEEEGIETKDIPEKLYAVTRCNVNDPMEDIPETWKKLHEWVKNKGYFIDNAQWLEKVVSNEEFILDLYLPIKE